jgi:hypothetical protein
VHENDQGKRGLKVPHSELDLPETLSQSLAGNTKGLSFSCATWGVRLRPQGKPFSLVLSALSRACFSQANASHWLLVDQPKFLEHKPRSFPSPHALTPALSVRTMMSVVAGVLHESFSVIPRSNVGRVIVSVLWNFRA